MVWEREREREKEKRYWNSRGPFNSLRYKVLVKESRPINVTRLQIRSFPLVVIRSVAWTLLIVLKVLSVIYFGAPLEAYDRYYLIPDNIVGR